MLAYQPATAYKSHTINDDNGTAVFELRLFSEGDEPFVDDDSLTLSSTWSLSQQQEKRLISSISRWAEVITPGEQAEPAIIHVGLIDDFNAFGNSQTGEVDGLKLTHLQQKLQGRFQQDPLPDIHGLMALGKPLVGDSREPSWPHPLPIGTNGPDLSIVAFHELGHALGIASAVKAVSPEEGVTVPQFNPDGLLIWEANMRDSNGDPAKPGQFVRCDLADCYNGESWEDIEHPFDLTDETERGRDRGYVTGPHIRDALNGAMPGVPVHIGTSDGPNAEVDDDFMGHIELDRSMMSHQNYRNHTTFMEAELAALQDLGYDVDRGQFFGYSEYRNDQNLVNTQGFFRRNSDGTAYLEGEYNTASLGMGLHVYGSRNRIVQRADLLTIGDGGVGARVDGADNQLVVEPGTRVHANGLNGRGLLFTYGKGHELVQRGEVMALGENGVGVSFDFGGNGLGNGEEYRGSYIYSLKGQTLSPDDDDFLDELKGPLVERYDLTGHVAGNGAAIHMASNAYVGEVNVMRGARIYGDIVSQYAEVDQNGDPRLTSLNFGLMPDAQGRATVQADSGFTTRYDGNIQGPYNLVLSLKGGRSSINGEHAVHGVSIDESATLMGNSRYDVVSGTFTNAGTLAPGNSLGAIEIQGDYTQTARGTLSMEFNADGEHDRLNVSGDASVAGEIKLATEPDWYPNGWRESLDTTELVGVEGNRNDTSSVVTGEDSPTLRLTLEAGATASEYQLTVDRAPDAYSQYATGSNERAVGETLDREVAGGDGHSRERLYSALDASATDGSDIGDALGQIAPDQYTAITAASVQREQTLTRLLATQSAPGNPPAGQGRKGNAFAIPLGSDFSQDSDNGAVGYRGHNYGVVFGGQTAPVTPSDWVIGVHGALVDQSVRTRSRPSSNGETTVVGIGVHARYKPDPVEGANLFGLARASAEENDFERVLNAAGYRATHDADWTGSALHVAGGGGYYWPMGSGVSIGPVSGIDYTRIMRPALSEDGDEATRLALSSTQHDALQGNVGVSLRYLNGDTNDPAWQAHLDARYARALLSRDVEQQAAFRNGSDQSFVAESKAYGRDALKVQGGLDFRVRETVRVGLAIATMRDDSDYREVSASGSFRMAF